jgi:Domain of unknown function (DUF5753)
MYRAARRSVTRITSPARLTSRGTACPCRRALSTKGFSILKFADDGLPDVVYTESLTVALYIDQEDDVQKYVLAMESLPLKPTTSTRRRTSSTKP